LKGQFITIEGVAGAGKTSLLKAIEPKLSEQFGDDLVFTREPGGSKVAEAIRNIVLGPEYTDMDPMTEALLFAAARRQHLKDTVLPAIESGKSVISDRYVDS
jgi:dTMP kinase